LDLAWAAFSAMAGGVNPSWRTAALTKRAVTLGSARLLDRKLPDCPRLLRGQTDERSDLRLVLGDLRTISPKAPNYLGCRDKLLHVAHAVLPLHFAVLLKAVEFVAIQFAVLNLGQGFTLGLPFPVLDFRSSALLHPD